MDQEVRREVRRDEWGLLGAEVELLNNAHIEIATSDVTWADIDVTPKSWTDY